MTALQCSDLFRRQHHNDILCALRCLNGSLLLDAECYFGGGTAIVLNIDEYRESVDIDFLCASQEGYTALMPPRADSFAGVVPVISGAVGSKRPSLWPTGSAAVR